MVKPLDPAIKAQTGLTDEHLESMQVVIDAIGAHEAVFDKLCKEAGETTIYPKSDLESRGLQAFKLFKTKPGFAEKFAEEMDKHFKAPKSKFR